MSVAVASARNAPVAALPDRPRCVRCGTLVSAVAIRTQITQPGDYSVITQSCQHQVRATKRRCGQPYALVASAMGVTYLFADSWELLSERVERALAAVRR